MKSMSNGGLSILSDCSKRYLTKINLVNERKRRNGKREDMKERKQKDMKERNERIGRNENEMI